MHEFSVVRTLLTQIDDIARRNSGRVSEVRVCVGEFSGVDADLLQLAFAQLAPESCAERAQLKIERTELQARCEACRADFAVKGYRFVCPNCAGNRVHIVCGEELTLESVLLETEQ